MEVVKALPTWAKVAIAAGAVYGAKQVYDTFSEKNLTGEVVVLTGAGGGIGRLMAIRLAKLGCRLALWDLQKDPLEKLSAELVAMGIPTKDIKTYVADVSDRVKVYELAKQVYTDFGKVDILINNAGIVSGKKILEVPDSLAEKTVQVNTIAHFWTVKAFLPAMVERDHGHIVTIASAAGTTGVPGLADYCASKFGAVGFHESIRLEMRKLGKFSVKTTLVTPYYIDTGMFTGVKTRFPLLLPILQPDYVANKIVKAIQTNQEWLAMPRLVYIAPALKSILPVNVSDAIGELLGISSSMDEFKQTRAYSKVPSAQ